MAQIPIYRGEGLNKKRIPTAQIQSSDISKAAQLPFLALANQANNIQNLAAKKYESDLNFANKKLQQDLDFNNKKLGLKLDQENALYKADLDYTFQKHKANSDFKTKLLQLESNAKLKLETSLLAIERKTGVQNIMQELNPIINELKTIKYASSSTLADKENFRNEATNTFNNLLFNSKLDEKTKQIAQLEFNSYLNRESMEIDNIINSNVLNLGTSAYNKEIDNLIYEYNYSQNPNKQQYILHKLLGENSIVYEMANNGLLVQGSEAFKMDEIKNKLFGMESELMINGENANPQKWLDLQDQGYWVDRLSNDQIINYEIKAAAEVVKINKANISQLNKVATSIDTAINSEKFILTELSRGNIPYLESLLEQSKQLIIPGSDGQLIDPALPVKIQNLINMVDAVDQYKRLNVKQQEQGLIEYRNGLNKLEQIPDAGAEQLKIFETIFSNNKNKIENDMLVLAFENEVIGTNSKRNAPYEDKLDALNFYDKNQNVPPGERVSIDSITKRIDQALFVAEHYNEAPQFLTKVEAEQFKDLFAEADAAEIVQIATMIQDGFGIHALSVFEQINNEAPAMAEIGGHVLNGNTQFALDIAAGGKRKQSANVVPNFENNQIYYELVVGTLGNSMVDNIESMDAKLAAIENVIINRGLQEGWVDESLSNLADVDTFVRKNSDKITKIINESVGAKYQGNTLYSGGTYEYNENQVIVPSNFLAVKDLEDFMQDNMTDELLMKAGGEGVLPVASPFVDMENRKEVVLNAANVFGEEGKAYYWDQIAPGQYLLALLNPSDEANPDYLHYPGTDDLFVFNLNNITSDLNILR